jgi:hypothetical protein
MLDGPRSERIETTLLELLEAIQEAASDDDEAFAVFEYMLARNRISVMTAQVALGA